jgi:ABC-type oligopeptide transport system substrate-binding subunit
MRIRTCTVAAVVALALGGTACGEDNESADPSTQPASPVNTDTPSANPQTVAPNADEIDPDDNGGG